MNQIIDTPEGKFVLGKMEEPFDNVLDMIFNLNDLPQKYDEELNKLIETEKYREYTNRQELYINKGYTDMKQIPLTTLYTTLVLKLSEEGKGYCANLSRAAIDDLDADKTNFEIMVDMPIDLSEQYKDVKNLVMNSIEKIVFGEKQ